MAEQDGHRLITSDLNQTFIIKDYPDPGEYSFSDDSLLHTGNSTRSLLTPLYASDYESPERYVSMNQIYALSMTACSYVKLGLVLLKPYVIKSNQILTKHTHTYIHTN